MKHGEMQRLRNMILIDANVILRYLLKDNEIQARPVV